MSGIALLMIAVAALAAGYLLYGRWLQKSWGVDLGSVFQAPAEEGGAEGEEQGGQHAAQAQEGGADSGEQQGQHAAQAEAEAPEPRGRLAALARQAASTCAPGAVAGSAVAVAFGWLPALLWIIVGGVAIGAAQDFAALWASAKTGGKSLAQLADQLVGPRARRLLLLFCWLFSIVTAAVFADMAASALVASPAFISTRVMDEATFASGASATALVLLAVSAGVLGYLCRRFSLGGAAKAVLAICLVAASCLVGMVFPIVAVERGFWDFVLVVYLLFACCSRPQSLKRPGELICFVLLVAMLALAVLGIIVGNPSLEASAFEGFAPDGAGTLFPVLFAALSCGAVSGFHALAAADASKAVASGRDLRPVGYGAMLLECLLAVCAVVCVCAFNGDASEAGSPLALFSASAASLLESIGLPAAISQVVITTALAALAACSLDAVVRVGIASWRELVLDGRPEPGRAGRFFANRYTAALIVLIPAYVVALGGYEQAWALFGSSNELLAALALALLALFLKASGKSGWALAVPALVMLAVSAVALVEVAAGLVPAIGAGGLAPWRQGAQLVLGALMLVLGLLVAAACLKAKAAPQAPAHSRA